MARKAAQEVLARVRLGTDPAREKGEARRAATVAELAERFVADHVDADHVVAKRKPGARRSYRHLLQAEVICSLGSKKAADLPAATWRSLT